MWGIMAFIFVWVFLMVCMDFEKIERKKEHFKWIPASTRFEWVREFNFKE